MCTLGIPLNVSITSNAARQFRQPNHAKSALDVVVRLVTLGVGLLAVSHPLLIVDGVGSNIYR